jgi:hypothetical protein
LSTRNWRVLSRSRVIIAFSVTKGYFRIMRAPPAA